MIPLHYCERGLFIFKQVKKHPNFQPAAGFIPVVGWAGRAIKGGSAIVKTAKGMNAAIHMLDAYKSTKAMDILNKTEKGIYGLYTANSAWEYGSGRDMFGNKLTEEQRQNALWNGLTMGLVGGGAHFVDKGGLSKLANKAPHSTAFVRDKVVKAQESLKQIGKQVGNKTHHLVSDLNKTAKRSYQAVGKELAKVDIPVVVRREMVTSTGERVKILGLESRKLGDVGGSGKGTRGTEKKTEENLFKRSKFRKGTRVEAESEAPKNIKGNMICPTCGKDIPESIIINTKNGPVSRIGYDLDHYPDTWAERIASMKDGEVKPTRKEVLDEYNKRLRVQCNECNISHAFEGIEGTFKGEKKDD